MMDETSKVIWDVPTRITHWGIAICMILNLFFTEDEPHQWFGYVAVFLILFRCVWGFMGKAASRFSSFPLAPMTFYRFVRKGMNAQEFIGHNPVASLVYIFVWLTIIALGVTGYMMGLDVYWGEEWLEELHEQISLFLQILIGLHLLGIAIDSVRYRRKTWLGMITGRRS